ncbi:MAG: hypothetical protein ACRD28_12285 [Acidobacteriaceae bacterium]
MRINEAGQEYRAVREESEPDGSQHFWLDPPVWLNRNVQKILRIFLVIFAILGIVVSVLAFQVHYSNKMEPCDINARWDCGIVNHSSYSVIH